MTSISERTRRLVHAIQQWPSWRFWARWQVLVYNLTFESIHQTQAYLRRRQAAQLLLGRSNG